MVSNINYFERINLQAAPNKIFSKRNWIFGNSSIMLTEGKVFYGPGSNTPVYEKHN